MPIPGQPASTAAARPPPPPSAPATLAQDGFDPAAGILACLLPGLGHWYLGQRARAVIIAAGILGLFFGGMLIGGIDVVDRKEDTIWFAGEALVGPIAFGVDYIHQNKLKVLQGGLRSANPGEVRDPSGKPAPSVNGQPPPNTKSLGRMNEMGTLFCTIAGMLNLIVVIDALLPTRRVPR